jgi:hypothetical protein
VNCPAETGAAQIKLPVTSDVSFDEVPVITTYEFGVPPLQLTSSPELRVTVAAAPGFSEIVLYIDELDTTLLLSVDVLALFRCTCGRRVAPVKPAKSTG